MCSGSVRELWKILGHEKPAKYEKRNWRTRLSGSDSSNSSFNADFLWPDFFYNSLRFTCPHLFCAESTPHHRIDCPILLNRPSGKQEICCQPVVCRICSTIRKDKWKPLNLYTVNIKKSTIPSVWFSKWIRTHFTIPVFRPYFYELLYGLNIHFR